MWDRERAYEDQGVSRGERIHWGYLWYLDYERTAYEIGQSIARNLHENQLHELAELMAETISETMLNDDDYTDEDIDERDICGEADFRSAIEKQIRLGFVEEKGKGVA